jgi:hypothetical protein
MTHSEAGKLGAKKTKQLWRTRYEKKPNYCTKCLKKLPYEKRKNKFCNNSCAASFNNLGKVKNFKKGTYSKLHPKVCQNCSNKFFGRAKKYCSLKCSQDFHWKKSLERIETTGNFWNINVAKKYLSKKFGYKCSECGICEWQGKRLSLILDHIDGNPYNSLIGNLRLLCPNCDSLTPTFKGKNKGNGRYSRRQRYQEGKSF